VVAASTGDFKKPEGSHDVAPEIWHTRAGRTAWKQIEQGQRHEEVAALFNVNRSTLYRAIVE
jgi:hypothetical protein